MERKINVWDLLNESKNKKETLLKIATCLEKPVSNILSHLSLARVNAVFETFELGKPHIFAMPDGFSDAFSISSDVSECVMHRLSSDRQKIMVEDFEILYRVVLNKDTDNDLAMLIAKELANIEDSYYRDLRAAVYKENGICSNSCLISVLRPITIVPLEGADGSLEGADGSFQLIAYELLNMCLPFNVAKK